MMKVTTVLGVLAASVALLIFARPVAAAEDCAPQGQLHFVCGPTHSEDLALVPGTHWIIASGSAQLYLINAETKKWRVLYPGEHPRHRQDMITYGDCPGPVDPNKFSASGLYIRRRGQGISTLYTMSRETRNSVEVFEVDSRGAEPAVTWIGCAEMPKGTRGNGVAALPDGTILATSTVDPGKTRAESFSGQISGSVYEWHPGKGFHQVPGTQLSGDNGIEVSPDGKQFYVNATGGRSVTRFTLTAKGALKQKTVALDFGPDNIRWGQNGMLYISGRADEPACGGTMKAVNGKVDSDCLRGFEIVRLDPKTMKTQLIIRTKPDPAFNAWSTALQVDHEIWIPGYKTDRVGYLRIK